jgi:hypothetical protein
MRAAWFLIAAGLLAGPAHAQPSPAAQRQVAIELREGGRVVASSQVRLRLGRPAAIALEGPYAMRLRIDAADGGGFTVQPSLHVDGPTGWTATRTSALTVTAGAQGRSLAHRPAGPPLEIAVSID